MKALVLAGGSGTRLWPLTHTSPKQLVPVANKPVLHYVLEDIARAGITEVGIVVGETCFEIQEAVGDGSKFGLQVTYLPQERPLGLAHAVLVARDYLGDDDFAMYLGDSFAIGGAACLVREFRADRTDARVLLTQVPDPTAFGVAEVADDGRVLGLEEKPARPKSDMAMVGVYLFTSVVHEAVRAIAPSGRGELEITDALQWLIDTGHEVRSTRFHGYWRDAGDALGVLEANRSVLEDVETRTEGTVDADSEVIGRVRIEAGAQVRGSRVVGPAVIGCNTVISNSYIGPYTSIAEECRVQDTEIEYSVVLREARLDGVGRLRESLIGRNANVTSAVRKPLGNRLILGDHSEVQISP
ncbi:MULTISPECIES: glucose-1-phosphate thymidylyltransferase [unclassified Streptomyces]|uniref:glucose-1-phosphate thymidylyltransferase n=1 Tax=unclassified Streptomyces TaxID=2593676 RepID=UPI0004771A26|nr:MULTISPECIES: glucose-1-phosphate thymidylyltransferase [unclassified Streptomyces]MYT32512.1 glucose-1-phosphate thymidylyltransferase [Streptomyces sp. SID8354]